MPMLKIVVLICCVMLPAHPMSAQVVTLGGGLGVSQSWITGPTPEPIRHLRGSVRYVRLRLALSQRFALELGVQHAEKGYELIPPVPDPQSGDPVARRLDNRVRFTYLEIPVVASVVLPIRRPLGLKVSVGVSNAFKRAALYAGSDLRDQIRDAELNAIIGAGLVVQLSRCLLEFDVRYEAAMESYQNRPLLPVNQNRALALSLGLGVKVP